VYSFPPVAEICARLAGNFCQYMANGQIVWFGCLSAISQLASREGEGGGVRQLCLHSVTQRFTTWPRWREQGGGLCSLPLAVDHFLQEEFYTLFLNRFRSYKIASPPQTKMTSKDDIKGLVSLKFLHLCCRGFSWILCWVWWFSEGKEYLPQSNAWYRAPTELIQHDAYRGELTSAECR
jgi:hypothetical protein